MQYALQACIGRRSFAYLLNGHTSDGSKLKMQKNKRRRSTEVALEPFVFLLIEALIPHMPYGLDLLSQSLDRDSGMAPTISFETFLYEGSL